MSPVLEDRLCHLAIATTSFERAAEVANAFGIQTDDSQIQRLVQRTGARALAQEERRVEQAFDLRERDARNRRADEEAAGERFALVVMLDGTMLRSRGVDWGLKPASASGERVAWHELKAGLVIRVPTASSGKRPAVTKYYVASDGGPEGIGRKLYAEALRRGLEHAERVYVIADGAVWIWNLAAEHFPGSMETLDFYHASEHLWVLARSLWGESGVAARAWVIPLLRNLKRCGGEELQQVLTDLLRSRVDLGVEQRQVLEREAGYFRRHRSRLDYPGAKRSGMPLGSGSMESACSQLQGRFKCPGQFWSRPGERNLLALELAWRNRDWNELWVQPA